MISGANLILMQYFQKKMFCIVGLAFYWFLANSALFIILLYMKKIFLFFAIIGLLNLTCKKAASPIVKPEVPTEKIIEIKTKFGNMYMWLYKQTPLHRANFLGLADTNYFDNTTFHRVIQNFVIQGGDPNSKDLDTTNDGDGGPGYMIPAEFIDSLKHDYGSVGAARDNNPAKSSDGSQFYIVTNKAGTHFLDKNYTVFGKIIAGMNVADSIAKMPKNASDRPYSDIKMDVNILNKTEEQLKTEFGFKP